MTPLDSPVPPSAAAAPASVPARILCVDDEPSIVSALKRLFRPHGYAMFTAYSGKEGLELLAKEPVDLVISDMRMPEMDGAAFLEQVKLRWPHTQRILLTGFADLESTIAAINRSEVFRYIAKPWNEDDLLRMVQGALEQCRLRSENARLLDLTRQQNAALRELNASLDEKIAARTAELAQALTRVKEAHGKLKQGFLATVRTLSSLFELRGGRMSGHSRRVAETARQLAQGLDLDEAETQEILLAGLLHDIGKIGLPDHLMEKPFNALSQQDRAEMMRHPERGEAVLMGIEQFKTMAQFVRHHHECFDGSGYPDHLAGLAIPLGARILAVANDFDAMQLGTLVGRPLKAAEARTFILGNRGKRYDPAVVDVFLARIADSIPEEISELPVRPGTLAPGMVLTRDLLHPDGYLLLAKGQIVDETIIKQLLKIEGAEGHRLTLYIQPQS